MTNQNLSIVNTGNPAEVTDKIIVSVAGEDEFLDFNQFGLTFDSSEAQILQAVRPLIQEKYSVDLMGTHGDWLYKTRKALTHRNIHIIPNSTAGSEHSLSYLDDTARLKIYETITTGCHHLWSKNKLQEAKMNEILAHFSELAEKDPLFLARFTSYAFKKLDSKDLKVVATFMSSLSDADGTLFVKGGEYHKPNWRLIAQAAFCELDPKLALRVLQLANKKYAIGSRQAGTHFSRHLKTAARKYIRYREANPKALEGIKKAGMGNMFKSLYRIARVAPSSEAVKILRWKQKPGFPGSNVEIKKSMFDFKGLGDVEIAKKIRKEGLKPQAILGALPNKISPVIAAAILEQCSGDQAVVLTSLFEEQGLLKNPEVLALYEEKIHTAKQALDRVERIKQQMAEETQVVMREAKAHVRKEKTGDIGKIFMHIDISGSMNQGLEVAKKCGSIFAECVQNPQKNFHWGLFNGAGQILRNPDKFTSEGFMAGLYGIRPGGSTNCLALFGHARELGADLDVFLTDGQHTDGNCQAMLTQMKNAGVPMPKSVVIVKCGGYHPLLENAFRAVGVPVAVLEERALTESALVTQAVKNAALGARAIIDEIMEAPLLALPEWWESIK